MQFVDLTLADGQATPVNHTFKARNIQNGVAKWQDISGGIPVLYPSVTVEMREPTKAFPNYRVRMVIKNPIGETLSGANYAGMAAVPTKAYDATAIVEFILPQRSSTQARKDALAYVANFLANVNGGKSIVQDLDFVA